ncbi:hypothetical protein NPIL_704071 [Nephila pilipes]|uniref:Uncharacterized protein n=1 Tax=Nephila pilipes TaxID=299642 RepID=A0A8X6I5U3_NEPPI|nr:hypothetical protein NPIL_704071 [Nephila pilipes]
MLYTVLMEVVFEHQKGVVLDPTRPHSINPSPKRPGRGGGWKTHFERSAGMKGRAIKKAANEWLNGRDQEQFHGVILTTVNYPEDSMVHSHWEWSAKGEGFSLKLIGAVEIEKQTLIHLPG